jgi:hypothetical protein
MEKWSAAEKLCLKFLDRYTYADDSLAEPAILRYMYLRCVGAKLGDKVYSKEEALQKVNNQISRPILTPPKPFYSNGMFNCFTLADNNTDFFSCASNNSMTVIQIFETYTLDDPTLINDTASLEGKNIRMGAFVKEIKAEGYSMPRLEIIFDRAFIWAEE